MTLQNKQANTKIDSLNQAQFISTNPSSSISEEDSLLLLQFGFKKPTKKRILDKTIDTTRRESINKINDKNGLFPDKIKK